MATSLPKDFQIDFGKFAIITQDIDLRGNLSVAGSITGAVTGNVTGNVSGNWTIPVSAVAAAGSTVSDAAQLAAGFNVVSGANGTKGVVLPPTPTAGTVVIVKSTVSGQALKVWPDSAATINAISSNASISLTLTSAIFIASSSTQWYTVPLLPS
jgi:hypothetical protein